MRHTINFRWNADYEKWIKSEAVPKDTFIETKIVEIEGEHYIRVEWEETK